MVNLVVIIFVLGVSPRSQPNVAGVGCHHPGQVYVLRCRQCCALLTQFLSLLKLTVKMTHQISTACHLDSQICPLTITFYSEFQNFHIYLIMQNVFRPTPRVHSHTFLILFKIPSSKFALSSRQILIFEPLESQQHMCIESHRLDQQLHPFGSQV